MASVVTAASTDGAPLLALHKLDKPFGATHALKAVDLTFERGEIHATVGENGPGKPTLIKVLMPEVYGLAVTQRVFHGGTIAASQGHADASQETILTEAIGVQGKGSQQT